MRVYFLAEKPCTLFLNGVALGTVDKFERVCEMNPKDEIFCELKAAGAVSVRFVFNEAFLFSPPEQIKLYYTEGAVAVYACDFIRADQSVKMICSRQFADTRTALFWQGRLQFGITRGTDVTLLTLADFLETGNIYRVGREFLVESDKGFALVSWDGKLITQSVGRVLVKDGSLQAELPFGDSMGHTAVCNWENGKMTSCKIRTSAEPTEATFALALFESALIGADTAPFLSDGLKEKAGALKEFLGDYSSVVLSDRPDRVGLVFPRKERVFDVRYFRIKIQDGKVSNIIEE